MRKFILIACAFAMSVGAAFAADVEETQEVTSADVAVVDEQNSDAPAVESLPEEEAVVVEEELAVEDSETAAVEEEAVVTEEEPVAENSEAEVVEEEVAVAEEEQSSDEPAVEEEVAEEESAVEDSEADAVEEETAEVEEEQSVEDAEAEAEVEAEAPAEELTPRREANRVRNSAADTRPGLNDFKDFTHWSISVNGGLSQYDGDAVQAYNQLLSESRVSWTLGLDVEYTFNPYWGLVAEFQYVPYEGRTSSTTYGQNDFVGNMYEMSLQASINLFNVFGQYRKTWKWNLYLNAGLGMTFYNLTSVPVEGGTTGTRTPTDIEDGRAINFPLYLNLEYNINEYLAVGFLTGYRFHNKDNFEGEDYTRGTYNDGAFTAQANFRVKLAPNKKEGGHMRNVSVYDYRVLKTGENNYQDQLDSLSARLRALEDTVYNAIAPKVEMLTATEPDEDGDGVPDFRDREPNTPKGSLVNYWGESISDCCDEIRSMLLTIGDCADLDLSVYFGIDKSNITKESKQVIDKVAKRMKADSKLMVEIKGYCDYPASKGYNLLLSERRVK